MRALIVYANNIALPAPDAVARGLQQLRANGVLWTLSRAPVTAQLKADHALEWTFTTDPALQGQLATALAVEFPLQSDVGVDSGPRPILGADDLPRAIAAKICSSTGGVAFLDFVYNGTAVPISISQPPHFRVQFQPRYAVPKNQFAVQSASFEVEGCAANCSRYFTRSPGDLRRWDSTRGCFLGAP
jgi:hypothetical protein